MLLRTLIPAALMTLFGCTTIRPIPDETEVPPGDSPAPVRQESRKPAPRAYALTTGALDLIPDRLDAPNDGLRWSRAELAVSSSEPPARPLANTRVVWRISRDGQPVAGPAQNASILFAWAGRP